MQTPGPMHDLNPRVNCTPLYPRLVNIARDKKADGRDERRLSSRAFSQAPLPAEEGAKGWWRPRHGLDAVGSFFVGRP